MPEEIRPRLIEEEMKESYVDYAMSVITSRALPDVKDGLKPVQRRILYAMHKLNLLHNKPFKKSAHVVGTCLAKYHPHGDQSVYDAMARMAQDFSLRYPLVDGQGNWGSVDGDPPAAQRYTEARLKRIAEEMIADIEKNTVNFAPNYDNSLKEPTILPGKIPNLLLNGASGIAVGMATNIPPHNIQEVISATIAQINNPEISIPELMQFIKGPDFPTAGIISGLNGIKSAYMNGRGHIIVKAKAEIKDHKIIITEIPYQVNKSQLLINTANLVRNKKIQDITDIRDESDRDGIRVVIEARKNANMNVVLNQLYAHTSLQTTFPVMLLALVNGEPKILTLKEIIHYYILHRKEVVTRKTQFELNEAQSRAHILEGLKIAIDNLDSTIKIIKASENPEKAKISLIENFKLTEKQSLAILDMKLQRLTSLEHNKIKEEYTSLLKLIEELKTILASEQKILEIIKSELLDLKTKYQDERRTEIVAAEEGEVEDESLIPQQQIVITATHQGYIKQNSIEFYKQQKRGGKGIIGTETKDQDFVKHLFVTSNHNYLLFFSNKGKVYWLKAFNIPEASRYSKGKAIINLLNLEQGETINAILPISKFREDCYLLFATKKGLLKKTALTEYSNPRKSGIIAINLRDNDELVKVKLTTGNKNYILATKNGSAVRFSEKDITITGRSSSGVRGVKLENENDEVIGLEPEIENSTLLTITEKGYGKRTIMTDYRLIRRGGKGVTNIKITEKNGKVVAVKTVSDADEIILITEKGIIIRIPIKDISTIGRNTQGVRIIRLHENDKLKAVAKVIKAAAL